MALSACNMHLPEAAADNTEIPPSALTATTVLTELASDSTSQVLPTATLQVIQLSITEVATPTLTSTPLPTEVIYVPTASLCDVAGFVEDVTIPDGTEIEASSSFTKTWELRNDGTCTWNSDYDLEFSSGDIMSGDNVSSIGSDSVSPGETIEVSVDLVAPEEPGHYVGYWMLRNDSGSVFGIGSGNYAFYVDINVVEAEETCTPTMTTTPYALTHTPEVTPTPSPTEAQATSTATATPAPVTFTPTPTAQPDTATPTSTPASTSTGSPGE